MILTVDDAISRLGLDTLDEEVRKRWLPLGPFSICREVRQGVAGFSVQDMRTSRRVRVATKREATQVAKAIERSWFQGPALRDQGYKDPRGELRTIKSVTFTPQANVVTFEECGHSSHLNATMTFKVGTQTRCFYCRIEIKEDA